MGTLFHTSTSAADIHLPGDYTHISPLSFAIPALLLGAVAVMMAVNHLTKKYNSLIEGPLSKLKPLRARVTIRIHARND